MTFRSGSDDGKILMMLSVERREGTRVDDRVAHRHTGRSTVPLLNLTVATSDRHTDIGAQEVAS